MPRQTGVQLINDFGGGLVTEATPLNFPPNAAVETWNCRFNNDRSVSRRFGLQDEANPAYATLAPAGRAVNFYVWKNAAGRGTIMFVVVQFGNVLYFYDAVTTGSLSGGREGFTVNLESYRISGAPSTVGADATFAEGNGYLFVAHPYCDPIYIEYNPSGNSLTTTRVTIRIRDFEGVEDGLGDEVRPTTLSALHRYNLFNQGWYATVNDARSETDQNAITHWSASRDDYPSNCDVWWFWKNENDRFAVSKVNQRAIGNTPAPKGHYILSAFQQDRSGASGVSGIPVVSASYYRPSQIAFFAGRVWYAGVNYGAFGNRVYYSQIIEKDEQIGRCHQLNDPVAEENNDLLATDGGVVTVLEMGTVYKMYSMGFALLLFASNGVWAIAGGESQGFSATDYSVKKLSSVGMTSPNSFVDLDGVPLFWGINGIYTITPDQGTGVQNVQSISVETIREFYEDIPPGSKRYAKGVYDRKDNVVYWLYSSDEPQTFDARYRYNRVLCFNVGTKAFFPWSFDIPNVYIMGAVSIQGRGSKTDLEDVTNNADAVVTNAALESIQTEVDSQLQISSVVKYFTIRVDSSVATWAETRNSSFLDYGRSFSSYLRTGWSVDGQGATKIQSPYVFIYLDAETAQALDFQHRWDFTNTQSANKFSTMQRIYLNDGARSASTKKLKVRGTGRAVQMHFQSISGYDFKIIGWSIQKSVGTSV